ncbi:hypothetical protein LINPERPRIM_LOCUS24314 [Linum perenne]
MLFLVISKSGGCRRIYNCNGGHAPLQSPIAERSGVVVSTKQREGEGRTSSKTDKLFVMLMNYQQFSLQKRTMGHSNIHM